MNFDFWLRIALGVLVIVGVWNAFDQKMVFGKLGAWARRKFPEWLTMPLFDCPMCMASVWGTTMWFGTGGDFSRWWAIYVVALSGMCKLVAIEWLNRK
jgi:hypothetical protein